MTYKLCLRCTYTCSCRLCTHPRQNNTAINFHWMVFASTRIREPDLRIADSSNQGFVRHIAEQPMVARLRDHGICHCHTSNMTQSLLVALHIPLLWSEWVSGSNIDSLMCYHQPLQLRRTGFHQLQVKTSRDEGRLCLHTYLSAHRS